MDGEKYRQFLSLVDGVIDRVGISEVRSMAFVCDIGSVRVTPAAFETISGQRQIEQRFTGGGNHRSFYVAGNEVTAIYEIPKPRSVPAPGEYIDLCCEIPEAEIKTVLSEHTVIAAEAECDG